MIFRGLFGNFTVERVFFYMLRHGSGYAQAVSRAEKIPLNMIQKQLIRLERIGVLKSEVRGRIRTYSWNDKYRFKTELLALLQKGLISQRELEKRYPFQRPVPVQKTATATPRRKGFDSFFD